MTEEQVRKIIQEELSSFISIDRYTFQKNIQIFDARNIQLGKTNGTKIGTATNQKLGVYGVTPVIQGVKVDDPTGGAVDDSECRTALKKLIDAIEEFGITSKT